MQAQVTLQFKSIHYQVSVTLGFISRSMFDQGRQKKTDWVMTEIIEQGCWTTPKQEYKADLCNYHRRYLP